MFIQFIWCEDLLKVGLGGGSGMGQLLRRKKAGLYETTAAEEASFLYYRILRIRTCSTTPLTQSGSVISNKGTLVSSTAKKP